MWSGGGLEVLDSWSRLVLVLGLGLGLLGLLVSHYCHVGPLISAGFDLNLPVNDAVQTGPDGPMTASSLGFLCYIVDPP